MSCHPKSWADKTCIWADIVHWPAIILSSAQYTSLDMFKHFFFKAQDDDVEDMMEYATSGEFVL